MYRFIILSLFAAAAAAPRENSNPDIKMLPQSDPVPTPSYRSSIVENPDIISSNLEDILETDDSRTIRSEQTTEDSTIEDSTETAESTTERLELKTTPKPNARTPKFYSKLSYFEKPNYNSIATNLVERAGRRKFISRCRCEKISNCPRLQITVPRCPDEYFLCC